MLPALKHAFINPDFIIPEWCTCSCAQQLLPGPHAWRGLWKTPVLCPKPLAERSTIATEVKPGILEGKERSTSNWISIPLFIWCNSGMQITLFCLSTLCRNAWKATSQKLQHCFVFLLLWGQHHAVDFLGMTKTQILAAQCYFSKVATPLKRRSKLWALFWESCLLRCQELSTDDS